MTLSEQLEAWFSNPENVKAWEEKIRINEERKERYIQKLASLTKAQRSDFIQKCIDKYESDEYKDKEYSKGYQPRCNLYYTILDYAEVFGEDCYNDDDFLAERYKIDNKWIIELYNGQGSFVRIYKDDIKR